MTWTYDCNPGTDTPERLRDAVRYYVGDTESSDQLIKDEEIAFLLAQYTTPLAAAAAAADALCARFARQADMRSGNQERKCSQRSRAFGDLAQKLRKQADSPLTSIPIPFTGGVSKTDSCNRKSDTDRVKDTFSVGIMDHEGKNRSFFDEDCNNC